MKDDKNTTEKVDFSKKQQKRLGELLEEARNKKGITQVEAAKVLGITRQTLILMEKGRRPYVEKDVKQLTDLYACDFDELIKAVFLSSQTDDEVSIDIWASLREEVAEKGISPADMDRATESYQKFVDDCSLLDEQNKTSLRKNLPTERTVSRKRFSESLAESLALQERNRLGLGEQPGGDLRNLLEVEVGLRSLYDDLPSSITGLFAYRDKTGGFVLVNRNQRPEQCLWTLIRCYGNMLHERYRPGIVYADPPEKPDAKERFAERFATCFLLPATGVLRHYYNVLETGKEFLVSDLLQLARLFHVLPEKMLQRLVELRLANRDVIDRIGQGEAPGSVGNEPPRFTDRYVSLAVRAYKDKVEELAKVLRTTEDEAARIADEWTSSATAELRQELPSYFVPLNSLVDRERREAP